MSPHNSANIDTFLNTISSWKEAYRAATLSFVALKHEGSLDLLHGHLILPNGPASRPTLHFETDSIVAGCFSLEPANIAVDQLVRDLASKRVQTPFGELGLRLETEEEISTYLQLWKSGLSDGESRTMTLELSSSRQQLYLDESPLIAELRACSTPFSSMEELAIVVNNVPLRRHTSLLEITAHNCVQIDFTSLVKGTVAYPAVIVSPSMDVSKVSLGLSIANKNGGAQRIQYTGTQLTWQNDEAGFQRGSLMVEIPESSVIRCFASYDKIPQCMGWIGDPGSVPNLRYALHATFDPGLNVLRRYLWDEDHHQKFSRDFETGVAALLFMLGFSVEALSGKPLENGPDLVASTPAGELILVECTVGQLNKDGKLGKLADRAASVRQSLQVAGHNPVRVLPVIVSARPLAVLADTSLAHSLGIGVLTREDLQTALESARTPQDADRIVKRLWETLELKQRSDES